MKCLETEKLISYAYHLTDEHASSQVRAHLEKCPRCREIVEKYVRLDALLDEWKVAEPTPWFDARVRHAVEAQQARREAWGFWSWEGARGLALAVLGVLIVGGAVWFIRNHPRVSRPSGVAAHRPQQVSGPQNSSQAAELRSPIVTHRVDVEPARPFPGLKPTGASSNEDNDAQALEDYDLAANFDLLSELPRGGPRVRN